LILIFLSFSDLFRSSPFQICFTADLSLLYIFFSFASGGRQLGGDGAGFRLLLWPLQLVAEGNGMDLWAALCWLLWLTVWAALMGGGNEGKGRGEREANLFWGCRSATIVEGNRGDRLAVGLVSFGRF
jgi:hypothetical protein